MYVVYLTSYRGGLMPPFYIGSTSYVKIQMGYRGSVTSKAYKSAWKYELKNNPHLFRTLIISTHNSREEALLRELELQGKLGVVKSPMYINMSLAVPKGFFGRDVLGELNPMHGKPRPDASHRMKLDNPMSHEEVSRKVSKRKAELRRLGEHKSTRNKDETLKKSSERMLKNNPNIKDRCCTLCLKITTKSAMTRCRKCKT